MSGGRFFVALGAILAGLGGSAAWAQPEDLTRGKTPAQLFAADCAGCHRNPRGLAKSDARSLADFLRVHYTASKESAAAIANYLVTLEADPRPQRPAASRAAPPAAKPASPPGQTPASAAKPAETSAPKPSGPAGEARPSTPAPETAPAANPQ